MSSKLIFLDQNFKSSLQIVNTFSVFYNLSDLQKYEVCCGRRYTYTLITYLYTYCSSKNNLGM